jgi:hypothetical protein
MDAFNWYMVRFESMGMDAIRLSIWNEYVNQLDGPDDQVAIALLDQQLLTLCMDKMAQTAWRPTILKA